MGTFRVFGDAFAFSKLGTFFAPLYKGDVLWWELRKGTLTLASTLRNPEEAPSGSQNPKPYALNPKPQEEKNSRG